MEKQIIKNKEEKLNEIFKRIKNRDKKILKTKPYYIYEPSLTSNTLIKDFEKEFWAMIKLNKCQNCGALAAKYKKINNLRFFRIIPSEKDKKGGKNEDRCRKRSFRTRCIKKRKRKK